MQTVLRATSDTLAHYLMRSLEADPDVGPLFTAGTLRVTLNTPEEMQQSNTQGLSVWLYRLSRDEHLLNSPPARVAPDRLRPTPFFLRLHYLLTPVVTANNADLDASAQREQEIMGLVLQAMHDRPVLRGPDLQYTFAGTGSEVHTRLEPMTLEEITRVWQALSRSYQLSMSFETSVVMVASRKSDEVAPPVREVVPEYAVIVGEDV